MRVRSGKTMKAATPSARAMAPRTARRCWNSGSSAGVEPGGGAVDEQAAFPALAAARRRSGSARSAIGSRPNRIASPFSVRRKPRMLAARPRRARRRRRAGAAPSARRAAACRCPTPKVFRPSWPLRRIASVVAADEDVGDVAGAEALAGARHRRERLLGVDRGVVERHAAAAEVAVAASGRALLAEIGEQRLAPAGRGLAERRSSPRACCCSIARRSSAMSFSAIWRRRSAMSSRP